MALLAGERVFVYYDLPGPRIWHERLVLGPCACGQGWHIILTPDGDVYEEQFGPNNGDIFEFRAALHGHDLPYGVMAADCYRFLPMPGGIELQQLLRDGAIAGAAIGIAPGAPPGAAPVVMAMAAPAAVAVAPAAGVAVAVAGVVVRWVYVETRLGKMRGDEAVLTGAEVLQGVIGLKEITAGAGDWACIRNIGADNVDEFRGGEAHADARILPLEFQGRKRQERTWKEVTNCTSQIAVLDWNLPGPRTVTWCVQFINRQSGGPEGHHRQWKLVFKLDEENWGVAEHGGIMKAVARFAEFDGVDLSNLAGAELLLRRAQLIEYVYSSKGPGGGGAKGGNKGGESKKDAGLLHYESSIFMGSNKDYGDVMVAPELLEYVSKEVEKDAAVMKQVRKAREERESAAKKQ
jgi:hypothetical protein